MVTKKRSFSNRFSSAIRSAAKDFTTLTREMDSDTGDALITGGEQKDPWNRSRISEGEERINLKDIEFFIFNDPMVFAAVNILWPLSLMGKGYKIKGDNAKAVKLCKEAIMNPLFESAFVTALSHTIGYGKSFIELSWTGDGKKKTESGLPLNANIDGYIPLHPRFVKPKWNDKGVITGYVQKVKTDSGNDKETNLDSANVLYLKLHQIGDAIDGIGLVEPLAHILDMKRAFEESSIDLIERWANPFWHISKKGANSTELAKIDEEIGDINRRTHFTTSEKFVIDVKGAGKKDFPNLEHLSKYLIEQIAGGLRIPKDVLLLGGESINRATIEFLLKYNENEIMLTQQRLSVEIQNQIFGRILKSNGIDTKYTPKFVWNPLSLEGEKERIDADLKIVELYSNAVASDLISLEVAQQKVKEALNLDAETESPGKKPDKKSEVPDEKIPKKNDNSTKNDGGINNDNN